MTFGLSSLVVGIFQNSDTFDTGDSFCDSWFHEYNSSMLHNDRRAGTIFWLGVKIRDLSRLDFGGNPPKVWIPPPKIFGQNYIFFTMYYLLLIFFFL